MPTRASRLRRMDEAGVDALREAIKNMHGVHAIWRENVPVRETFNGAVVWEGVVEVFEVKHPKTARCYAWSHATENGRRKFYAVLHVEPVVSAAAAVEAAIVADERR